MSCDESISIKIIELRERLVRSRYIVEEIREKWRKLLKE